MTMAMSSIDIITFYAIYIPVVMAAIIIGFILGYKMAGLQKANQMFPHTKVQNNENSNK